MSTRTNIFVVDDFIEFNNKVKEIFGGSVKIVCRHGQRVFEHAQVPHKPCTNLIDRIPHNPEKSSRSDFKVFGTDLFQKLIVGLVWQVENVAEDQERSVMISRFPEVFELVKIHDPLGAHVEHYNSLVLTAKEALPNLFGILPKEIDFRISPSDWKWNILLNTRKESSSVKNAESVYFNGENNFSDRTDSTELLIEFPNSTLKIPTHLFTQRHYADYDHIAHKKSVAWRFKDYLESRNSFYDADDAGQFIIHNKSLQENIPPNRTVDEFLTENNYLWVNCESGDLSREAAQSLYLERLKLFESQVISELPLFRDLSLSKLKLSQVLDRHDLKSAERYVLVIYKPFDEELQKDFWTDIGDLISLNCGQIIIYAEDFQSPSKIEDHFKILDPGGDNYPIEYRVQNLRVWLGPKEAWLVGALGDAQLNLWAAQTPKSVAKLLGFFIDRLEWQYEEYMLTMFLNPFRQCAFGILSSLDNFDDILSHENLVFENLWSDIELWGILAQHVVYTGGHQNFTAASVQAVIKGLGTKFTSKKKIKLSLEKAYKAGIFERKSGVYTFRTIEIRSFVQTAVVSSIQDQSQLLKIGLFSEQYQKAQKLWKELNTIIELDSACLYQDYFYDDEIISLTNFEEQFWSRAKVITHWCKVCFDYIFVRKGSLESDSRAQHRFVAPRLIEFLNSHLSDFLEVSLINLECPNHFSVLRFLAVFKFDQITPLTNRPWSSWGGFYPHGHDIEEKLISMISSISERKHGPLGDLLREKVIPVLESILNATKIPYDPTQERVTRV